MLRLYNLALFPLRGLALLRAWAAPGDARREWLERRARVRPEIAPGGLWLHGASVGEARLVSLLARAVKARRPKLPLAASALTPTGRAQLPGPPEVDAAFFLPLDFAGYPRRILHSVAPSALVLLETELWPNLIDEARQEGVPTLILNGRLSPERMARYQRLKRLYRPLLASMTRVAAQSDDDAARFVELGVPPSRVEVTGNIKYDLPAPTTDAAGLRRRFGLDDARPVVVAGSTGAREEGPVLDAYLDVRRNHPSLFLVLAPRHPERADEAARQAASRGVRLRRISAGDDGEAGGDDGILVDRLGELASLYPLGRAAFVGGSLVPVGGHNLLEPAAAGVPVVFGPHVGHVREPAQALIDAEGGRQVSDAAGLAEAWGELVGDAALRARAGARAERVVRDNRGAVARSVELILELLDGAGR